MNKFVQKRKNGGVEAKVSSKHIKNINEVRGVFTVPGGGFISLCNGHKVSIVETDYGWNRRDIAGSVLAYNGREDGQGLNATFNTPMCVIQDAEGNIVVADTDNNCLRKIDKNGIVSTFSGRGSPTDSRIYERPRGMALMADGRIAVVDTGNNCVRIVEKDGTTNTRVGGPISGYKDGDCDDVMFNEPCGIILMPDNTLLVRCMCFTPLSITQNVDAVCATQTTFKAVSAQVSDTGNNVLRQIFGDGRTITWAGKDSRGFGSFRDGSRSHAQFDRPEGMAITWDGVVLVADRNNNRVRQIDGSEVSTLAGTGEYSQGRQLECDAGLASFRGPIAVGIDHEGNVLVCEESSRDDEIRIITGTGYAPALHHRQHHMAKVIESTAMGIVQNVTDVTRWEIGRDYEEVCKNALMYVNVSTAASESGRQLMHDETFSGLETRTLCTAHAHTYTL